MPPYFSQPRSSANVLNAATQSLVIEGLSVRIKEYIPAQSLASKKCFIYVYIKRNMSFSIALWWNQFLSVVVPGMPYGYNSIFPVD